MSKSERNVLIVLAILLLLGLFLWRFIPGGLIHGNQPPRSLLRAQPSLWSPARPRFAGRATSSKDTGKIQIIRFGSASTKSALPATTPNGAPVPPKLELHKELIPKDIEIIRCYYSQEVVPPGKTFGFDINGSGFNSEFEKMIKVESGHENVSIKNLHMITANQIHGDMEVGPDAKTGFVYPRVLIQNLPVFSAPDPFAVVRKGEVLTVFFISMEENGRGGRFRVITNLNEELAKTFRIEPSTKGIEISDLQSQLPYVMEGHLQIGPGVAPGDHGMTIFINGKEAFKRIGMIRIVHPNIGQTGFVQGLMAEEKFHRPGDEIQIYVQGTGLSSQDTSTLDAKVNEFDLGKASFTYISPLQLRLTFQSPTNTPTGSYGVRVLSGTGQTLFEKKDVFLVVPANWVASVQVLPPVKAGSKSSLKILGRDFSDDFLASFRIDVDEPGITITNLKRADASNLDRGYQRQLRRGPGRLLAASDISWTENYPPFR